MTFNSMQHMPLTSAYLCADCHCVGNCASHCRACASGALIGLAGVLNREEEESEGIMPGIEMTLIVGKQRNGPIGEVPVIFIRGYTKFVNMLPAHSGWSEPEPPAPAYGAPYKDE